MAQHFYFSSSFIPHDSQICELLFLITFSKQTLLRARRRALPALKALGRAQNQQQSCSGQGMPEGEGVCRALLDCKAMLLSSNSCMQKHRWKCFPCRHFANPCPEARQLRSSKKYLPVEEKRAPWLFAELWVHQYRCAWRLSRSSISNPLAAICVSARVAPSGLHFFFF